VYRITLKWNLVERTWDEMLLLNLTYKKSIRFLASSVFVKFWSQSVYSQIVPWWDRQKLTVSRQRNVINTKINGFSVKLHNKQMEINGFSVKLHKTHGQKQTLFSVKLHNKKDDIRFRYQNSLILYNILFGLPIPNDSYGSNQNIYKCCNLPLRRDPDCQVILVNKLRE
jgi:hypothetical protein